MPAVVYLRDSVAKFAALMERTLQDNDHKGGWKRMNDKQLLLRLDDEATELEEAIARLKQAAVGTHRNAMLKLVAKEAADVANFAMMIADNFGDMEE
jgi:hypothetical protein